MQFVKEVILLSILCLSLELRAEAQVELEQFLRMSRCKGEIVDILEKWGSKNEWTLRPDPLNTVFASPTEVLGAWVSISFSKSGFPTIVRATKALLAEVEIGDSTCQSTIKVSAKPHAGSNLNCNLNWKDGCVGDDELKKLLSAHPNSLVAIWSPHMPYSLLAMESLLKVAKESDLFFIPLLDAHADKDLALKQAKSKGWNSDYLRKNDSFELEQRLLGIHFPSAQLFIHSEPKAHAFLGLASQAQYARYFKKVSQ